MASARPVTNHETLRRWVEERDGQPATVRARGAARILRVDFPVGAGEEALKPVSWSEWFKKFDGKKLVVVALGKDCSRQKQSLHQAGFEKTLVHQFAAKGSQCLTKEF